MPKIVDHAERRSEIAAAVWRVIGAGGIGAATVRAVAAESGWSMGAVRHYFASQDDLLTFACQEMEQRVLARVTAHYAGVGRDGSADPERAVRVLCELLPVTPDQRTEVLVWLAFMTRARLDDAFDDIRASSWAGERYLCRLAVADARGLRLPAELTESLDPALEPVAERMHLLIDGLSLQGLAHPEHWPPERIREAVRDLVADVVAGVG